MTYLDLDVTSDESVASVVEQVIDRFGRIDVLVNNAGVGANGAAEEFSVARTQDVFDVNVDGVMRMTKAVLPHMRAQRRGRGHQRLLLSGFVPSPFMAIYTSTKHAVEGYSGSVDHEVREHGVRILLVEPGPTNTAFGDHSVQGDTPMPLYASDGAPSTRCWRGIRAVAHVPAVVAKVIVAAATDRNPKLRRTAGSTAARISVLHRVLPARTFDRIVRKFNRDAELTLTLRRTALSAASSEPAMIANPCADAVMLTMPVIADADAEHLEPDTGRRASIRGTVREQIRHRSRQAQQVGVRDRWRRGFDHVPERHAHGAHLHRPTIVSVTGEVCAALPVDVAGFGEERGGGERGDFVGGRRVGGPSRSRPGSSRREPGGVDALLGA